MKPTQLPRFNPNLRTFADKQAEIKYTFQRDATRRRRIRNQRLGDVALGFACFGVGWMLVHIAAGAWR